MGEDVVTLRKGRPPRRLHAQGWGPAWSGADPDLAVSTGRRGQACGEQARGKRPETRILRLPLSAGLHVSGLLPLRPVDTGRAVKRGVWTGPSVTETSPGPGEATKCDDRDILGSEHLGLQPSSAAVSSVAWVDAFNV